MNIDDYITEQLNNLHDSDVARVDDAVNIVHYENKNNENCLSYYSDHSESYYENILIHTNSSVQGNDNNFISIENNNINNIIDTSEVSVQVNTELVTELPNHHRRTRKRKGNSNDWKANVNKKNRLEGKQYKGKKKIDGKWLYTINRPSKVLKEPCHCKLQNKSNLKLMCSKLTENQRKQLFNLYWSFDKGEKKQFLKNHTTVKTTSRKRTFSLQSRRHSSIEYFLLADNQRIRICKTMFLNTLGIGEKTIRNLVCNANMDSDNNSIDNDFDRK